MWSKLEPQNARQRAVWHGNLTRGMAGPTLFLSNEMSIQFGVDEVLSHLQNHARCEQLSATGSRAEFTGSGPRMRHPVRSFSLVDGAIYECEASHCAAI